MSLDPGYDIEDPGDKLRAHMGGGRGISNPGIGPAGGFQSYAGSGPGMSSGGYDFNTPGGGSRAAMLKRLMAAIQAMQGDTIDAKVAPGEYIMNPVSTADHLPELEQMNAEGNEKRFFLGGLVDDLNLPSWAGDLGKGALKWGATAGLSMIPGVGLPLAAAASQALMNGGDYSSVREGLSDMGGEAVKSGAFDGVGDAITRWRVNPREANPDLVRGLGRHTMEEPEHFAYGGYVAPRQRYGGAPAGVPNTGTQAPSTAASGYRYSARPVARPAVNINPRLPAAPPPAANPFIPNPANTPGSAPTPVSAIDELLRKYSAGGAFDPSYGMSELEAALNRQNQGAQAADVTDLMASGIDDPSLYASQLLASRGARSKQASSAMADARLKQTQSAQDYARQLLNSRHDDQINELLKRIK